MLQVVQVLYRKVRYIVSHGSEYLGNSVFIFVLILLYILFIYLFIHISRFGIFHGKTILGDIIIHYNIQYGGLGWNSYVGVLLLISLDLCTSCRPTYSTYGVR